MPCPPPPSPHSSFSPFRILSSISISCLSQCGTSAFIHSLALYGSRQWFICQNIVGIGSTCQLDDTFFAVYDGTQVLIKFSLTKRDNRLYMPQNAFAFLSPKSASPAALSAFVQSANSDWSTSRPIIYREHHHVCGRANYSDMKLLLERYKL